MGSCLSKLRARETLTTTIPWLSAGPWCWQGRQLILNNPKLSFFLLDSSMPADLNGLRSRQPPLHSCLFLLLRPCCKFPKIKLKFAFSKKSSPPISDICCPSSRLSCVIMCRCSPHCDLGELDILGPPCLILNNKSFPSGMAPRKYSLQTTQGLKTVGKGPNGQISLTNDMERSG